MRRQEGKDARDGQCDCQQASKNRCGPALRIVSGKSRNRRECECYRKENCGEGYRPSDTRADSALTP